ncbi:MAG: hypothetical protein ACJAS9_000678 [Polaribacter sp.]|jgi:hypothetical protein
MPHLLFKLNSVPEDEANEVRQVLDDAEIFFYETDSGRWGFGFSGMWTKDDSQLDEAKSLIQAYQIERYQEVTEKRLKLEESGQQISRINYFMTSPIKFSVLIIFASLLAYFTVIPFFN